MSFLDDLEQNKQEEKSQQPEKSPRDLWEGCFKYFKHFHSILSKNKQSHQSKFNLLALGKELPCELTEPFSIKRLSAKKDLILEFKMTTKLLKTLKIARKDERSAAYLQNKLAREGITSVVKKDKKEQIYIELKENIPSTFHIILENEKDIYLEYININSSSKRRKKLNLNSINQETMDEIAKYILGKNPNLYKETISDEERDKIRQNLEKIKQQKAEAEAKIQAELEEEKRQEELAKANTLKERSKRYITKQSKVLGANLMKKIQELKNKGSKDIE